MSSKNECVLPLRGCFKGTRIQWDLQLKIKESLTGETAADLKMKVSLWDFQESGSKYLQAKYLWSQEKETG